MKRPLPLWIAAVVPATLAGHGLAYALSGQTIGDGRHSWMAPVLECSLALLAAICITLIGSTLLQARILVHTATERSFNALWPRLAFAQLFLFLLIEYAEGTHATLLGCAVQLVVAAGIAALLALFAGLLSRCVKSARAASRYLQRLFQSVTSFVSRRPAPVAYALAVHAGTARFQRPPPQS